MSDLEHVLRDTMTMKLAVLRFESRLWHFWRGLSISISSVGVGGHLLQAQMRWRVDLTQRFKRVHSGYINDKIEILVDTIIRDLPIQNQFDKSSSI